MSKDKKSMDDVLASIRKIIRTDPNAMPPDASSVPAGFTIPDDTAKSVLERIRKEQAGDEGGQTRALSGATDDPEATANAVLERLRLEADKPVKKPAVRRDDGPERGAELRETPGEPPVVKDDGDDVPVLDDAPGSGRTVSRGGEAATPAPAGMMLDELEETIRRVVRDELTGEMGRRMTKNVQRMIEAEIRRFMAGRDDG